MRRGPNSCGGARTAGSSRVTVARTYRRGSRSAAGTARQRRPSSRQRRTRCASAATPGCCSCRSLRGCRRHSHTTGPLGTSSNCSCRASGFPAAPPKRWTRGGGSSHPAAGRRRRGGLGWGGASGTSKTAALGAVAARLGYSAPSHQFFAQQHPPATQGCRSGCRVCVTRAFRPQLCVHIPISGPAAGLPAWLASGAC